ncbi:bifunctional adenosylcobinamide kinase/adenosylcobinamide-phosphate guanylyltransferase [Prosthecomicrobium sp. N25]|uniref:bifunctional adenosylcobinamide kinase/adenosylcobinamide-phosphate guanylyltransferase n=1 Tax=Prosthecomicrobium sp. N25 TaxID=3129254 RepID=UPI003076A8CD
MAADGKAEVPAVDFVLGGARSGKTRLAETRARESGRDLHMIATATAGDAEMAERIARHRADRGDRWTTHEEPLRLADALGRAAAPDRIVVVDCLTLWLTNLMFDPAAPDPGAAAAELAEALAGLAGPVILVSNEVGLGIVPENALARRFRDLQGRLNQTVAAVADRVTFVAAGLPLVLKDRTGS